MGSYLLLLLACLLCGDILFPILAIYIFSWARRSLKRKEYKTQYQWLQFHVHLIRVTLGRPGWEREVGWNEIAFLLRPQGATYKVIYQTNKKPITDMTLTTVHFSFLNVPRCGRKMPWPWVEPFWDGGTLWRTCLSELPFRLLLHCSSWLERFIWKRIGSCSSDGHLGNRQPDRLGNTTCVLHQSWKLLQNSPTYRLQ